MSFKEFDNSAKVLMYLALSVLKSLQGGKQESLYMPPELLYIFSMRDIVRLSKVYGGKKMYIPKVKDITKSINLIQYVYSKAVLKMTDEVFQESFNVSQVELGHIQKAFKNWKAYIEENGINFPSIFKNTNSFLIRDLNILLSEDNDVKVKRAKKKICHKYKHKNKKENKKAAIKKEAVKKEKGKKARGRK